MTSATSQNRSGWPCEDGDQNVVTVSCHRRRGIVRRVMLAMPMRLEEQDVRHVALHTPAMGWPLYEELGFVDGNEMQLNLVERCS